MTSPYGHKYVGEYKDGKPNGQGTGTVMFDSANPSDLNILFGDAPFEFRVETAPIAIGGLKRLLKEPWK
jgi:hypothetical protein